MKEHKKIKERPNRKDYINKKTKVQLIADLELHIDYLEKELNDHLTAEQGDGHTLCGINCDRTDCKATIIPWCELKDFPCDKSPRQEPPELTVREVVEWCAEKQGCEINYGEIYDSNLKPIALDELTKIIRRETNTPEKKEQ